MYGTTEFKKLPLAERERRVREMLRDNQAPASTLQNNIIAERLQSRRRKVRQNDDDQTLRRNKMRERLFHKLVEKKMAAFEKNLAEKENERQATKKDAKDPCRRKGKKKGKSRQKASS